MDTLQRVISIIEKEKAKNLTLLQKELDTRNTNNAMVALVTKEDFNVNSLQQTVSMMRRTTEQIARSRWDRTVPLELGTLTTVGDAHDTADTKYSVYPVAKIAVMSKDRRDSIRK